MSQPDYQHTKRPSTAHPHMTSGDHHQRLDSCLNELRRRCNGIAYREGASIFELS